MAIEIRLKQGDEAAEAGDYDVAILKYSGALEENPDAFAPLIKRAWIYTKIKSYSEAKEDIERAMILAQRRGKMHEIALCYFRLGLVFYGEKNYGQSLTSLRKAQKLKCNEPSLSIWIAKAERDLRKVGIDSTASASEKVDTDPMSTSILTLNKIAPIKIKIKDDWYQDNESVTVTIYAKKVDEAQVQADFTAKSASISFPSSENSEYHYNLDPLFSEIDEIASTFKVFSTKIELNLRKASTGKWPSLEGSNDSLPTKGALSYPSSSKKAIDWSNFNVKEEGDESEDFFAKLYKDVDEDTRRAMMKSYVESNGTVLTTNWEEAKEKTFEISPPEGMQAKKW